MRSGERYLVQAQTGAHSYAEITYFGTFKTHSGDTVVLEGAVEMHLSKLAMGITEGLIEAGTVSIPTNDILQIVAPKKAMEKMV